MIHVPEAKIEDLTLGAILSNPELCVMARDLINEQVSIIFSILVIKTFINVNIGLSFRAGLY